MKSSINSKLLIYFILVVFINSCASPKNTQSSQQESYIPSSKELYDTIVKMDALWEDAYNNCKLDQMDSIISENLEFYHDQTGLTTSKTALMNAVKNNICGKVTRELLKGSIEVYPIHEYGAVEMGRHAFHNNQEPKNTNPHYAKFVHIWKNENGKWKITRVISLH